MTERLLTLEQVAEALNVSIRTVGQYRREGAIPEPIKLAGRSLRWRESDIDEWINAGCPKSQPLEA